MPTFKKNSFDGKNTHPSNSKKQTNTITITIMSVFKITYNSDTMSWDHQFPFILQSQPYGISPQTYAATLHKCDQIMYDRLKSIEKRRALAVIISIFVPTLVFAPALILSILGLTLWVRMPYLIGPVVISLVVLMVLTLLVPSFILKNKNKKAHRDIRDELLSFLSGQNASIYAPSHLQLMLKDYDTERGFGKFFTYSNKGAGTILFSSGPTIEIVDTRGVAFHQQQPQFAYQPQQQQQVAYQPQHVQQQVQHIQQQAYAHYQPQPQQPVMYYQQQQQQQQLQQPQYQEYYQPSSLYQQPTTSYQIPVQPRQETGGAANSKPTTNNDI